LLQHSNQIVTILQHPVSVGHCGLYLLWIISMLKSVCSNYKSLLHYLAFQVFSARHTI